MWFKHLHLYRLHDAPELSSDELASALQEHAAKPLGNADARRLGWTAPAGRLGAGQLVHAPPHAMYVRDIGTSLGRAVRTAVAPQAAPFGIG